LQVLVPAIALKGGDALIRFTCFFARELRSVFRRCARKIDKFKPPVVGFEANADGLRVRLVLDEVCIERFSPGEKETGTLQLPLAALNDFQGRRSDLVKLSVAAKDRCLAEWLQGDVPRAMEYELPNPTGDVCFPGQPESFVENPSTLVQALAAAIDVAATEGVSYATHRICLSGKRGEIAATDGRQLFVQSGFQFPWEQDLLVTNLRVWRCPEIASDEAVQVGRTNEHVVIRSGGWTIWLLIDSSLRFPVYREVPPRQSMDDSVGRIDPLDRAFLIRSLPNLPRDEDDSSVTLDLNGAFSIRSKSESQSRPTELVLARSSCTGKPVRFRMNREHLARMADLGFTELHVTDADKPIFTQDEHRIYVTMPFDKKQAIPPGDQVLQVTSTNGAASIAIHLTRRRVTTVKPSTPNDSIPESTKPNQPIKRSTNGTGKADIIAEAEALCSGLRTAASRAQRLLAALKRRRKQSKLVATTLKSLKELQGIEG
jgi:hypothetical protein